MPMENTGTNTELIDSCIKGDIKSQFKLYKKYSKAMYNIAIRILDNKMDAEDMLQESFITAFARLSDLEDKKSFGSWLKRIVINNCISRVRGNRVQFEEIEDHAVADEVQLTDIDEDIDPVLVHKAIKDLPAACRTVVVLYALEQYKHREIAEMLNISISTSKTQYRRGLMLLNEKLKHKIYVN